MEQIKIDRINELAAIAKARELTADEFNERAALRQEYINEMKSNLCQTLDKCVVIDENGEKRRILPKERI